MTSLNMLHRRFAKDQSGTFAIYFTFMLFVFTMFLGLAIDGGRAIFTKTEMNEALDSATLAATRALMTGNPTDAEILVLATNYFDKNFSTRGLRGGQHDPLNVHVDRVSKTVTITVKAQMRTSFAAVAMDKFVEISSLSEATYSVNDIELGLVLDTTGSMNQNSNGGGPKIAELKVAASKMFDILLPDNGAPGDTRIGIAPFSTAVNAGAFAGDLTNHTNADNCVVERAGAEAWTDADPTQLGQYMVPGSNALKDIDPTDGQYAYACPVDAVLPLTNDKDALKAKVNGFIAKYGTAGHLGTQWGWYLISPNWNSVWTGPSAPKPYGTKNLVKSIVVMTDGAYNTAYKNGKTSSQQAVTLCNNAKAQGILVYTIGFATKPSEEVTLNACASIDPDTGKPSFYHAENGDDLTLAFSDIAAKLGQLRVAR